MTLGKLKNVEQNERPLLSAKKINLIRDPMLSESWLQGIIADDPSILGLGELSLIERERKQHAGGRLDLLLADSDATQRFEVELQLGQTDPSHIIRCIEYWDIERRRYPAYDHIAVLVAEDVTSRFHNILSLMSGTIPIVALQLDALETQAGIILNFTKVLDQRQLREDDSAEVHDSEPVDRAYWDSRSSLSSMKIVDEAIEVVNQCADLIFSHNYKSRHVGLSCQGTVSNFIHFNPLKGSVLLKVRVAELQAWAERLSESELSAEKWRNKYVKISLREGDVGRFATVLKEMFTEAIEMELS